MCLCVCLCRCLCVCVCACVYLCVRVCMHAYICEFVSVCVCERERVVERSGARSEGAVRGSVITINTSLDLVNFECKHLALLEGMAQIYWFFLLLREHCVKVWEARWQSVRERKTDVVCSLLGLLSLLTKAVFSLLTKAVLSLLVKAAHSTHPWHERGDWRKEASQALSIGMELNRHTAAFQFVGLFV